MTTRAMPWSVILGVFAMAASAGADVAATGTFGIDISVPFPYTSGTFTGQITGFDAGPFSVGGAPVDLASGVGMMDITNGNLPSINVPALAANFNFDATSAALGFHGAGIAVCSSNIIACAAGQATFVGDITSLTDGSNLLPDGYVYTFDGTGGDNPGPGFDAIGNFGINAFLPVNVPAGNPVTAASDPTSFFDSRHNVLRDFLVDVTFAEVTVPGTIAFLGKSAIPGTLPANIAVQPDVSVFVDIVTGGGLAFTPPVDVCVYFDDVAPADGIVDGTSVAVNTIKVLHAAALGQNFQDVTSTATGGKVCGQVGTLSPFLVAVGPVLVSTTTTSTSTTLETFTTTSTTSSTTTSTLPTGDCADALACIDAVLGIEPCTPEVLPTKLGKALGKKLGKAKALIEKAGTASKLSKAEKSVAKARSQIEKAAAKATKFVSNKKTPISAACNDTISAVADVILTAIDEGRLGVPLPAE